MKKKAFFLMAAMVVLALALTPGCGVGKSRAVDSCSECVGGEYCVEGEPGQLYCADPCLSHISCHPGFWCVPENDEATTGHIVWVCMEERFYSGLGRVWSWGNTNCVAGGSNPCDAGMTCLVDDSANPDVYFCSDSCNNGSDCLSGCCYKWSRTEKYCAPYYPYCSTGIGEVYYWGHDSCQEAGVYECPSGMTCVYDDSVTPWNYYCSDSCTNGSQCVTGCCSGGYCAPERPFCI